MIEFEGDRDFSQGPADLWARLSDARFLLECVPGKEAVARSEADVGVFTVRPGLSFARGTLEVTLRVAEAVPGRLVRLALDSKGIGSSSAVEAVLNFEPRDGGSRVHWVARVKELGGLLRPVPQGLIRAAAQKLIGDAWASVEARLARA